MKNRFSFVVVTPSYNQASYIRDTLTSVYSQSAKHIIHIVMDGGSTDQTMQIIQSFGQKHQKLHATQQKVLLWESRKDKGQADAINKGIRTFAGLKKSGDWIFSYINSDDYYLPDAFIRVEETFQKNPTAQWMVGDAVIVDMHGKKIQEPIRRYKSLFRTVLFPYVFGILNPIPQPSVFIRWDAVGKIGLFNTSLSYTMDYEYWWRLYDLFGPPVFVSSALSAFRIQRESKGSTVFEKQFSEELAVARGHCSYPQQILHRVHNRIITGIYQIIK